MKHWIVFYPIIVLCLMAPYIYELCVPQKYEVHVVVIPDHEPPFYLKRR